ncbi:MAG: DUF1080 domain-containing protein [Candidatus Hydrogenedentota bacterium]
MRIGIVVFLLVVAVLPLAGCGGTVAGGEMSFAAWDNLSDGEDLAGWHRSEESHHGDTQAWSHADGTIIGAQDKPGNGGVLLTDDTYGDFVLALELNPDWNLDSGIFLRSTPAGKCYQIMVDNYEGGAIGGIYGEGIGGFRADPEDWQAIYNQDEWNKLLALVIGNPPTIDVWLNGTHVMSWQGAEKLLDSTGHIGLQVHAGERYMGKDARFRNIKVRRLN